jgi:hypothetical protein
MNLRRLLHRYVPAQFHDPVGLALRLVRTGDPAAWFAMAGAAAGAAAAPLDAALAPCERRLVSDFAKHRNAERRPLVFVCGAPRSGTTVVYQTLVSHLPVAYFSNLTALFPKSPLVAQRLFGRFVARPAAEYHSFYGRTQGLGGTNDALQLWDRWLGSDRSAVPAALTPEARRDMAEFFRACDAVFDRPLVNKNNSLNLTAHLVAECLPQATFLCLSRDRRQLARSLYRARCDIHGSPAAAYGVAPSDIAAAAADPVQSVCEQAAFYDETNRRQLERLGAERFWIVGYEQFCRDPAALVRRVAREVLGDEQCLVGQPPSSFAASRGERVPADVAARIDAELTDGAASAPRLAACG